MAEENYVQFFTATILSDVEKNHEKVLPSFLVNAKDRKYHLWERNPLSIDMCSREVLWQKLKYMYLSPVRAGACQWPEQYCWSSAMFYHTGINNFGWLTDVMD